MRQIANIHMIVYMVDILFSYICCLLRKLLMNLANWDGHVSIEFFDAHRRSRSDREE